MGMILAIFAGVCVLALLTFVLWTRPAKMKQKDKFEGYHYAHRGLHSKDIPENCLRGFELACANGYGIEMDLRLSKDEVVMVFHDDDLHRMCGIDEEVCEYTCAELQELNLGSHADTVPTLEQVLAIVDAKTPLIIELKASNDNEKLCEKAYEILKNYKGDYCIESFHPNIVRWFRKNAPHVVRGQLSGRRDREQNVPISAQFIAQYMLLNVISRPNFIAYNIEHKNILAFKIVRKLWRAYCVAWTVRDNELLGDKNFDLFIFEGFEPQSEF